ncbi:MAG: hypothetical protein ABI851_02325 [Saprospiraceae bacterium]
MKEWESFDSNQNPQEKAKHLAKLSIRKKAALTIEFSGTILELPNGIVRMEWDNLLNTACSHKLYSLIYEYCQIASNKQQIIPLNLLVEFIKLADTQHEMTEYILPSIGMPGLYLIKANSSWNYLEEQSEFSAVNYKESKLRLFLLNRYIKHNVNLAITNFISNFEHWTEKEKSQILDSLIPYASNISLLQLDELFEKLKSNLKPRCYALYLNHGDNPICQVIHNHILHVMSTRKWEDLVNSNLYFKNNKIDLKKTISFIPPTWFLNHLNSKLILNYFFENDLIETIAETINKFKDPYAAEILSKYLIDKGEFNEHFPIATLSSVMDHKSFNTTAVYFCRKMGDQIDLEAFLFLIEYFKHFWSDELLLEVLNFNKHKNLVKKYNLDVFYNFIPFRINPNSKIESDIPKQIKDNILDPLTYQTIINFRKILRK